MTRPLASSGTIRGGRGPATLPTTWLTPSRPTPSSCQGAPSRTPSGPGPPPPGPGLWRIAGNTNPEELIQGVERMELRFGVDANSDRIADSYTTANGVANWDNVITVSVALLVRSPDEYGTERDT